MQFLLAIVTSLGKKKLNMELNMILIMLLEYAYIRHSLTLQQFQQIPCSLSR